MVAVVENRFFNYQSQSQIPHAAPYKKYFTGLSQSIVAL